MCRDSRSAVFLQDLFFRLNTSLVRYVDTTNFCKSLRDWEGRPLDTNLQMDVNEFATMLLDTLEAQLAGSTDPKLLGSFLGGRLANHFVCQENHEHVYVREEPYYFISLDVKNKHSVSESLENYVQGETLTGENMYMCEKCKKKVKAFKRTSVKTLPDTLVLHLKRYRCFFCLALVQHGGTHRCFTQNVPACACAVCLCRFEFSMDTMEKVKINNEFSFPFELDMRPFTMGEIAKKEKEKEALAAMKKAGSQGTGAEGVTTTSEGG